LFFGEEAAEEGVVVELMVVKELREEIFCVVGVEVAEGRGARPFEAVGVIDLAFLGV
jgi:hypothetical protein